MKIVLAAAVFAFGCSAGELQVGAAVDADEFAALAEQVERLEGQVVRAEQEADRLREERDEAVEDLELALQQPAYEQESDAQPEPESEPEPERTLPTVGLDIELNATWTRRVGEVEMSSCDDFIDRYAVTASLDGREPAEAEFVDSWYSREVSSGGGVVTFRCEMDLVVNVLQAGSEVEFVLFLDGEPIRRDRVELGRAVRSGQFFPHHY